MELTILVFTILLLIAFISIQIFCIFYINAKETKKLETYYELPFVSVLLAARNEENTIIRCLHAFSQLDYPKDKIEFLIGNDDSQDNTKKLALDFVKNHNNFKIIDINYTLGKAAGKANVLAHLANIAKGDFFFITDSDVAVKPQWIKSMLSNFCDYVGIVSGTTTCKQGNFFENLQSLDWLHFMGYIKAFANADISCTSVGNNMAVRAEAYRQTGGYENIDFSITEDYKLFSEVTKRGWGWRNILDSQSLGLATYISSLHELLHQRKRWLIGARELPWNWKTLIVIYGLFLPSILLVLFINPMLAIILLLVKFSLQSFFINLLLKKTEHSLKNGIWFYFIYELYVHSITIATVIFYFLPLKSVWKGRKYEKKGLS